MPWVATKLHPAHDGGYIARKCLPADVREAYGELYGGERWEERLRMFRLSSRAGHLEFGF